MNLACKKIVATEMGSYAVAFLGFLLLYCIYLSPELLKGKLLAPGDGIVFYYPVTREWSLWVDNVLSGYPAFGDPQYLLWYPLRWLGLSYNSLVISGYVLASFFTFGLVRQLTANIWAGIFAGLVFGMNGFVTANLGHLTIVHAAAWLPLVIWAADCLVARRTVAWFFIGSLGVACMFLAGHPQIFVYGIIVTTAFFAFKGFSHFKRHRAEFLKASSLYVSMILLGVAIAGVQIGPLLESSSLSIRQNWSFWAFSSFNLPPTHSILLLFPNLLGSDNPRYFGLWDISAVSCYFGWTTLFLLIINFFSNLHYNETLFWIAIACLSFAFALGAATPLSKIAYHLPVIGSFRVPSRALIVMDLAVAILAGFGLEQMLTRRLSKPHFLAICITFGAIAVGATATVFRNYSTYVEMATAKGIVLPDVAFSNSAVYLPPMLAVAAFVLILIVVKQGNGTSAALLCGFLIVDLTTFGLYGAGRQEFIDRSGVAMDAQWRMVQEDLLDTRGRLVPLGSALGALTPGTPNLNLLYGLPQASGYGPLMLKRYADVTGIATHGDLVTPPASPALYQMLNVEWGMIGMVTGGSTRFGAGCGIVGDKRPINVEIPPDLRPTKIRLVSHMGCSTTIEQATPVLRIDVNDGSIASLSVRAGVETAEWAIDRPDVRKAVRHTRAHVLESFDADGVRGHWYDATLPIPVAAVPIRSLSVRGLRDDAIINIRDMTLIDDTSGRQLPVPLEGLRVVQPPNWNEMIALTTGGYLAKFRKSLGRAWLVGDVRRATPEAIVRAVHDGRLADGAPFDPARLAFVEEKPPDLGAYPSAQLNGRVDIVSLKPGKWVMEVEAAGASFLVISQTNYPGWHVSVNDEPAHLYQTNFAFQGVAVPPGRSRIVLEFWSASLILGASITLSALVLAVALVLWDWRRRLRRIQ